MWQFSEETRDLLAGSHTAVSRVDVLHSGVPVYTLNVVSGSVNADATRPVRRNLSCSLVDPSGLLTRGDIDDLLNPYECEIQPWRGVRVGTTEFGSVLVPIPGGFGVQPFATTAFGGSAAVLTAHRTFVDDLAPHGVFGLTARSVSDTPNGLVIDLSGQDRSMNYQGPMSNALAISGGTPVETAIQKLLATRNPGLRLQALKTGFTCGPLVFAPDIDVWAEAQELAQSVGARLFHDREGDAVLSLIGQASDTPVADYSEGDGLLLTVDRAEDSDTIKNVVIAESTNGAIRVVVKDTDTSSPTFAGGRYGERPVVMANQHFTSVQQARQAGASRLAYELGRSETVSFSAVPDPALDVDEVVTVHRPRAGLTHRGLLVATLDMPLGASETMRVGCRRSVLGPDGRIFAPDAA